METLNENIKPAEASTSKIPHQKLAPGYRIGPNGVILGPDGKPCRVSRQEAYSDQYYYSLNYSYTGMQLAQGFRSGSFRRKIIQ
jgi:hypothetical protein